MALYVTMLTRPAFAALGKADRVRILKDVFLGIGDSVPEQLQLGAGESVLRYSWTVWKRKSSLTGTLRRLEPTQFADVVLCLMSCAGLQVVVGDPSHMVVTTGLAYVTIIPVDAESSPPKGHATFVEVSDSSPIVLSETLSDVSCSCSTMRFVSSGGFASHTSVSPPHTFVHLVSTYHYPPPSLSLHLSRSPVATRRGAYL
jgi:hypothetical protein